MILYKKIILFFLIILLFNINCFAGSNVEHIFELAKYSVCKNVAVDILKNPLFTPTGRPTGKAGYFISQLNSLTAIPFPYRFEITNGYKEGFVYYALLGYVNEMNGDIPLAYRYYQNSLACIDEEKSFDYPLPRSEIYLAIGRTCLAAGRYMDAKDWLDNAFFEAGDNKQLQAAIDRVGIQRANEIGDYPEIIFLYQHLENLANQKTPRLDKEGCPKGGVVERTTDYGLRTTDYANYSQILFYSRKDRKGFSKLLTGISKLGIDNNLGVKDPLVDKFLNNIMRADDDEVKFFYDLLGWAIVDARAKAGDENYLAFLCNARTLFCKVYDFLNPEEDLKKVKKRIDEVRKQIANGETPWSEVRGPKSVNRNRKKKELKSKKLKIDKSGNMKKTPEIVLDDLLMIADWKLKQKDYKSSGTNYYLASLIATGTFANIEYDGTTMENAAIMGAIQCNLELHSQFIIHNSQFTPDDSYRATEATLQLYLSATNDEQRAEYDTESAMKILPIAHPVTMRYIQESIFREYKNSAYKNVISLFQKAIQRKRELMFDVYYIEITALLALERKPDAFEALLNSLLFSSQDYTERKSCLFYGLQNWKWTNRSEKLKFYKMAYKVALCLVLDEEKYFIGMLDNLIEE